MIDVKEIEKKLKAPFPASEIKWRAQQIRKKFKKEEKEKDKYEAIMLAYIDARAVMDRLDEAVGPNNWRTFYTETNKGRVLCELSINYNGEWVTKTDGAGDTGTEGEKGAISDALKRAAVNHGVNRLMYNFGDTRVELEPKDITTNRQGKPIYKWGAKKLSEKCRLPDWYLELLKPEPKSEPEPEPEPKQEVLQFDESEQIVLEDFMELNNDYLVELYRVVFKLNEEVEKKCGSKTLNDNVALRSQLKKIKEETKDDLHRQERRINGYLTKSRENALKVLNGE